MDTITYQSENLRNAGQRKGLINRSTDMSYYYDYTFLFGNICEIGDPVGECLNT